MVTGQEMHYVEECPHKYSCTNVCVCGCPIDQPDCPGGPGWMTLYYAACLPGKNTSAWGEYDALALMC